MNETTPSKIKNPMHHPDFNFKLGDRVKDGITGFTGIVTRRSQWLNNCNTYAVQPEKLKDGVPQKRQHFDEQITAAKMQYNPCPAISP